MATFLTAAVKNTMMDTIQVTHLSLHSANPSDLGTDYELTSTPYSRQTATLAASIDGTRNLTGEVLFNVDTGDEVSHIGYWDNTTFVGWVELPFTDVATEPKELSLKPENNGLSVA